jgi:Flp pilus assembly protein TadG
MVEKWEDRLEGPTAMSSCPEGERGAQLVEFALVAPLLILLLVGIIEFGWLFAQMNEIRHVAQEGARWGAVSHPEVDGVGVEDWGDLAARACGAANLPGGTAVTITGSEGGGSKGDTAAVTVTASVPSLTGLIDSFLPSGLSNTATFRLEQPAKWVGGNTTC